MQFGELAEYFRKLEETSSRLEMIAILANLLKKTGVQEIDKVCYLSLGRIGPLFLDIKFNLAEKLMVQVLTRRFKLSSGTIRNLYKQRGDLGEVAYDLTLSETDRQRSVGTKLSVTEVFEKLREMARFSGYGSQQKKIELFSDLLSQVTALPAKYLVRIVLGTMRLGFSDKTLIEAFSWMKKGDRSLKKEIEEIYHVYPDIGRLGQLFQKSGLAGIRKISLEVGVPVLPVLCQRIGTIERLIEKMGKVAIEPKYDGTRIQLHFSRMKKWEESNQTEFAFDDKEVKVFVKAFTRNLEEVTYMFPDLIKAALDHIVAKEAILDGEAVGYDPKSKVILPFQSTMQRKRKYGISEKATEIPLKFFVFDLLFCEGRSLLRWPYQKRRKKLEEIIKKGDILVVSPQIITEDARELSRYFAKVIEEGLEGIIAKKIDSFYKAGSRGFAWVKLKREEKGELSDTLDTVVLGYNFGTGQRTKFGVGAFLVGVYDHEKDLFESISKVGTGLTDEQWKDLRFKIEELKLAVDKKPTRYLVSKKLTPDVWVKPFLVAEILADEITRSPVHTAGAREGKPGFALRFPRLVRWREDKVPEEATTVREVERLFSLQRKK